MGLTVRLDAVGLRRVGGERTPDGGASVCAIGAAQLRLRRGAPPAGGGATRIVSRGSREVARSTGAGAEGAPALHRPHRAPLGGWRRPKIATEVAPRGCRSPPCLSRIAPGGSRGLSASTEVAPAPLNRRARYARAARCRPARPPRRPPPPPARPPRCRSSSRSPRIHRAARRHGTIGDMPQPPSRQYHMSSRPMGLRHARYGRGSLRGAHRHPARHSSKPHAGGGSPSDAWPWPARIASVNRTNSVQYTGSDQRP